MRVLKMVKAKGKINLKIYVRSIIAIVMLVVWLVVGISGVILWLAPEGQRSG